MAQVFTIGRGDDCDIAIPSPYLSSNHLTIELVDSSNLIFRITDQNSTNGTFVNGQKIDQADISPSDQVHLGEYLLKPADYMHQLTGKSSAELASPSMIKTQKPALLLMIWVAGIFLGGVIGALILSAQQWLIIGLQATAVGLILAGLGYAFLAISHRHQSLQFSRDLHIQNLNNLRDDIEQKNKQRELIVKKEKHTWSGLRKFEVIRKQPECEDITSFYLRAHDQQPIPQYYPGQYLTFNINIPESKKPTIRCYSLSDAPTDDHYRVSIKRQPAPSNQPQIKPGLASNYFHDHIEEGDIVDVKTPSGGFYLDVTQPRPVVLLAGGIGITPMLSMLNGLLSQRTQHDVWLFYGVRNGAELIHANHLKSLSESHDNIHLVICFSQPKDDEKLGSDFHTHGRVTIDLLKDQLPSSNFDFFLCGPGPFMQSLTSELEQWGVPNAHIHSEAFGPSSVSKKPKSETSTADTSSHKVVFSKSNKTVVWNGNESLLELAENNGISVDHGCRAGNCGTCLVALREGQVDYNTQHDADIEKGSCLACICQPKTDLIVDA
jgi:uncharacterized protein